MKNLNLIKRLLSYSHEKQSPQRFGRYAAMLIMLLTLGVGQMWADPWVKNDVSTGLQGTKTVGDKLNGGSEWWYNYQTNGGWSTGTDIQVLIGTSTSSYSTVDASWYKDDGSNKKVHANIGSFTFDKSGIWYAVGKYYASSKTAYTSGSLFTNNSSLSTSMSTSNSPYWTVNPPAVKSGTVAINATNTAAGSGTGLTSGSPIILISGMASTLTITATQNVSDANSALWCKFASGSYSSTTTYAISSGTDQTNQTLALAVKYRNNGASLDGTETMTTIYYKWAAPAPAITLTSVTPSSSIVAGNDITLVGTRVNSSNAISFQYTTDDGSTWTDITPKTSSLSSNVLTATWTVPDAHGATQTFKFRAKLAEATPIYSIESSGVSVYNTKTIKVKNTNSWGTLYLYAWDGSGAINGAWPGKTGEGINGFSCTNVGGGLWWDVTITSRATGFNLDQNVTGDANQTGDLSYSTFTNGRCLAIGTENGKKSLSNTAVSCLADALVSTTDAASILRTSATLGGSVSGNGNDKIISYGYYYTTSDALSSSNVIGTRVEVGTDNKSGSYTKSQTGLAANTKYYVMAYAKNGNGEAYGSVESFTTLAQYTVTTGVVDGQTARGSVSPASVTCSSAEWSSNVTASANPGYSFNSWTTSDGITKAGTTSPTQVKATKAGTIKASFNEVMRTVSVVSGNTNFGNVSTASLTSVGPETKSAEVTATPETGATFTRWDVESGITIADGYTNTSNPVKINATAASKTLTAVFTETTYTVTLSTADGSKGTVGSNKSVGQITAVEITATPKSGYMFSKWVKTAGSGTVTYYTGAGTGQVTDASGDEKETTYICVTGGNVTLQATWEPDRSSGYVVNYGNDGKNADGGSDLSQARAWKDGKLYRPTTAASDVSYFTFTAGVGDVDKVIEFKIHQLSPSTWYGYGDGDGEKIDKDISNVALNTSYGNGRLCITMPGSYLFTWDKSTNKLSIRYPNDVYYVRGGFNSWDWSHPMTETSTGVYSATINMTEANHTYAPNTEAGFKLLVAGKYYGKNSTTVTRSTSTGSAAISGCNTDGQNLGLTTDYTGDYTFTYTVATNTLQVTYPTAYKVTYGKGTVDGSSSSCSAKDIDNGDATVTSNSTWVLKGHKVKLTAPAAKTGYSWKGWYTDAAGTEGKIADDDRAITVTMDADKTLYACYTANNYTVTFDKNEGTTTPSPSSKSVTFGSAYGTLPSNMKHASKTFIGWYTTASDEGTHVTAETIVSTASNHTLYARYEDVYSVNVNFKCGDATVYPATSVNASPTSLAPTITAPEIFGYSFVNWAGSNATFADASSATTTVNATAATTITANYEVVPMVYFKNNLGWENVYVTFGAYFNGVGKYDDAPGNNTKPYYQMTQLGSTDIYYCEIPAAYTANNYASWANGIAFDNVNYEGKATSTNIGSMQAFYGGEFTGRMDFDPKATLFIPYNGDTETRNSGKFYKTGCWIKYNSTESGYQVNMNTLVTGTNDDTLTVKLTAANAGGYEFSAKVNLKRPNYSYGFKLYKIYQKNTTDLWFTNTGEITAATTTLPWDFVAGGSITAISQRCALHTEALGDYTITVSFATGKPMVNVEYPTTVGDWRLAYNDRIAWSGDIHDGSWYIYSRVVKAKSNAEDLVSFYVSKATSASAHVELQKCTAIDAGTGIETWTKQGDNLDLSGITATGIYNFKITQNESKVASAAYDGVYSGNFYIRTDASDGGWANYKTSGKNQMTYSEYAEENNDYTHYYMRFVGTGSNIKFCVANDYSECLTEYCVNDDFTDEWIKADGNVRFMWNQKTNAVSRAYISGSSNISDRFLVLEGDDKMFDETGNALTTAGGGKISGLNDYEMNFTDDQNWIYEATVKAKPGARVKLTAKYNNKVQYFYGKEGDRSEETTELLLGGSSDAKYKMHVVYDFKTNRLIKAFMPDGDIEDHLTIEADMMIIREHQKDADQITFNGGSLSEVKTVYGAMKFNKYTVNGKSKEAGHAATGESRYKRDLFYISFPFDVKLSEAFGFGTYGTHWIIEYYDGKNRAKNGFWADSDSNWKFVTPAQRNSFTMKAFEGYILALDLDNMTESASIWDNGVEDVYIYFPSSEEVENIEATNRLVPIDQNGYKCTINRSTPDGDRRVKDSYWHCIGVPSFANYSSTLYDKNEGTAIDWSSTSMPYLYAWNSEDNSLSITKSETFSFKATYSYIVQYAGESIYWSSVNVTPSSAPAARRVDGYKSEYEFRLELLKGEEKADQTFVKLTDDEHVTTGFEFNYDLSKEFNKNKANIYTMVSTTIDGDISVTQSAANVLPFMPEQTTLVPVGVQIKTNGEYTFAIPDGTEGIGVTLIDNVANTRTNLGLTDYTVTLNQGKIDGRFMLEISPISQVHTDIEAVSDQHSAVRKVMIDGLLYIVKDGVVYDAQGKRVQ